MHGPAQLKESGLNLFSAKDIFGSHKNNDPAVSSLDMAKAVSLRTGLHALKLVAPQKHPVKPEDSEDQAGSSLNRRAPGTPKAGHMTVSQKTKGAHLGSHSETQDTPTPDALGCY